MYTAVAHSEIVNRVKHIRDLHRQIKPSSEMEVQAFKRREQKTKDLLSNLQRTGGRPTLQLAFDFGYQNSMTTDGAHRLFGYDLDAIRAFDHKINSERTHLIESHVFGRDLPIELPLELADSDAFKRTAPLSSLVRQWQRDVPMRTLDRPEWRRPGTFHVCIGTQDSLGSSLPPGSIAQVEPINEAEIQSPNPRSIYLLQFQNGYRCSRCVVTRGRLHLLTSERSYRKSEDFAYPLAVRIVGRVRVFALTLPLPESPVRQSLPEYAGSGRLVLPWEQSTRQGLLATEYRRFVRSPEERDRIHSLIERELGSQLSERTKRRYRSDSNSEPHIDVLIHMTLEHFARYTDSLRTGGFALRGAARFSLETLLHTAHYRDLFASRRVARVPVPTEVWEERRSEMGGWPAILSARFPNPGAGEDRFLRLAESLQINGLEPRVGPGSWLMLEPCSGHVEAQHDSTRRGWSRPMYALRRGVEILFGHLETEGDGFRFLSVQLPEHKTSLRVNEFRNLRRIVGIVAPA